MMETNEKVGDKYKKAVEKIKGLEKTQTEQKERIDQLEKQRNKMQTEKNELEDKEFNLENLLR